MRDTDPLYGLREMLEYLEGLKPSKDRIEDARAGLAFLASRGFDVTHMAAPPVIRSSAPEDLRAARKALRLTNRRLADEAGLSINAVVNAQAAGGVVRRRTVDAILATLVRFGARHQTGGAKPCNDDA